MPNRASCRPKPSCGSATRPPGQLDEEWRVAPPRHDRTGIAASSCDRVVHRQHARSRAMHAEKEVGCVNVHEVAARTSAPAAIIEEK